MQSIVFIDTTLADPPTGGAHTFLVTLTAALVRRGWPVSVVTTVGSDRTIADGLRQAGVRVVDDLWAKRHLPEETAELLARWVHNNGSDVFVISNCLSTGWLALPHLSPKLPTVTIAHNDVEAYYSPLRHYGAFVDCAIGVSWEVQRKLIAAASMPAEHCRHIPYGVEPLPAAQASPRWADVNVQRPLRIGYIGRIIQGQKRVMDFVPLTAELARRGVDFELHLIGDGSERHTLERALQHAGVAKRVHFWGWLGRTELANRLGELDVFLLMSEYEGLPVALLEAMAHALIPVVSLTASGNAEVVEDGKNGFLLPIGDVAGFADRLDILAKDKQLQRKTSAAAWERSQDFSVERMVERYIQCFTEVASPNYPRGHRPALRTFPPMPSCRSRYPFWARKLKSALTAWNAR